MDTLEIADAIRATQGRWFGCTFTKRTTGETRNLVGRLGVTRHLRGGAQAYDPLSKGLLVVWSADARGYRSIPLDAVTELRIAGQRIVP
jgi:hypothetical protein